MAEKLSFKDDQRWKTFKRSGQGSPLQEQAFNRARKNLNKILGKPTGQGYGAARKGPDVQGPPEDVVVDEDYQQGKSFKVED